MPLSAVTLSAAIKTKVEAEFDVEDATLLQGFSDCVAEAIVEHIQANALVTLTSASVTTGAGAGGLVVGTGTVS